MVWRVITDQEDFYSLFEWEWPKFYNCRISHCDRMKIHTQHATLTNFWNIYEFSWLYRPPVTKNEVLYSSMWARNIRKSLYSQFVLYKLEHWNIFKCHNWRLLWSWKWFNVLEVRLYGKLCVNFHSAAVHHQTSGQIWISPSSIK